MNSAQNQIYVNILPQQAFKNLSLEEESFKFNPQASTQKSNNKRKSRTTALPSMLARDEPFPMDENEVSKKLSSHFGLLRDIKENERLIRVELDRTTSYLQLYEDYKKQRKSVIKKCKTTVGIRT
ncbi:hypothetical protein V6N13_136913 [Hibiscus sabdariffa]|uniref:Uncharacterized protein n=1 Tax=Hibiscus sabdariffa TaxID=183260 RepID=A0ABR2DM97_9ROSI